MLLPEFANAKWYQELTWSLRASQTCFRESITVRTSAQVRFPFNETDEPGQAGPGWIKGTKGTGETQLEMCCGLAAAFYLQTWVQIEDSKMHYLNKRVEGFNCYIFNSLKPDILNKSQKNNFEKWNNFFSFFF